MKKTILITLITILVLACSERKSEQTNSKLAMNINSTEERTDHWILLDSQTSIFNFLSQPAVINSENKFLMFSTIQNALLIYDSENKNLEKKISYSREGPNSLTGLDVSAGLKFVNADTILFYSKTQRQIYLSNISGEVYSKIKLSKYPVGFGSTDLYSPIEYRKGKVYLQILPSTVGRNRQDYENNYNQIAEIDLTTGDYKALKIKYPKEYNGKNVSLQLKMLDILYNKKEDEFIISYPLSHSIYVTNFQDKGRFYDASSALVETHMEYDKDAKSVPPSQLPNYFFWLSDAYGRIMFDEKSEIYFREARTSITEDDYLNRNLKPQKEIIVLNKKFQVINRLPHSGAWLMYHFFNKDVIFWNKEFDKYNTSRGNEDTLYFDKTPYLK